MKPKPLSSLNHFTVPFAICNPSWVCALRNAEGAAWQRLRCAGHCFAELMLDRFFSLVAPAAVEPLDHRRVGVIEEQGAARVEIGDAAHLLVAELEVEDIDVLAHPLGAHRLRNHDDLALDQPAE